MKHALTLCVLFSGLLQSASLSAVRGDDVKYIGGTLTVPEKTEGRLDLSDTKNARFAWHKGEVLIPYEKITSLEYGQKVGRRVGVAVAVTPLALFSKKRKHFLTLGFTDDQGKQQGSVFELSKGTVRTILSTLEARSGKKVEYESEEAKKNLGN